MSEEQQRQMRMPNGTRFRMDGREFESQDGQMRDMQRDFRDMEWD